MTKGPGPLALMDRSAAAKVRQAKSIYSVAAVGSPDQSEQSVILGNGDQLAVTKCPTERSEASAEHPDLANKGSDINFYSL